MDSTRAEQRLLGSDDEVTTPVLLPAILIFLVTERLLLTLADGGEAIA